MAIYTIYKATNKINGKSYIGITSKSLEYRRRRHLKNVKGRNEHVFHKALKKYGRENFEWEVICYTDDRTLEVHLIKEHNTHYLKGYGYNMTFGGEGTLGVTPWNKGISHKDNKQSKQYILISPSGDQHLITGIKSVKDFGLSVSSMRKSMITNSPIHAGKRKGWQMFKASEKCISAHI